MINKEKCIIVDEAWVSELCNRLCALQRLQYGGDSVIRLLGKMKERNEMEMLTRELLFIVARDYRN